MHSSSPHVEVTHRPLNAEPSNTHLVASSLPTPHGLIAVHATADEVTIDSPVPVVLDLEGQAPRQLPAGRHRVSI